MVCKTLCSDPDIMDRLIDDHRCICKNICDAWDQMAAARQNSDYV